MFLTIHLHLHFKRKIFIKDAWTNVKPKYDQRLFPYVQAKWCSHEFLCLLLNKIIIIIICIHTRHKARTKRSERTKQAIIALMNARWLQCCSACRTFCSACLYMAHMPALFTSKKLKTTKLFPPNNRRAKCM